MAKETERDPLLDLGAIEDEDLRAQDSGAHVVNAEPPPDKQDKAEKAEKDDRERHPDGTFKGSDKDAGKEALAKGDGKGAEDAKEKKSDHVPLAKYLEERNSLRAELQQRDITLGEFQKKIADLEAKMAPKPEAPVEPDYLEDPKGYVDTKLTSVLSKIEQANKAAAERLERTEQTAAQANQQVEVQQFFMQDMRAHEQQFVVENPDYYEALEHLRNVRAAQLREFTPEITKEQIAQTIRGEETQLAIQLARQGRSPAQTALNLARHYGYQPKAKADTPSPAPTPASAAKLPEVPSKRLPPDQSLGTGAGGSNDGAYREDEVDPVDVALASLFKRRA
jgi:hypothetical protein